MENVSINISGVGQELSFSVSADVAARVVKILNDSAFASIADQPTIELSDVSAKYRPLAQYLAKQTDSHVTLSFSEIEEILADKLPESAYKHKAWWSNTKTHSQATGWMVPGFSTYKVYPELHTVNFQRGKK